jgi:hypothetical protein
MNAQKKTIKRLLVLLPLLAVNLLATAQTLSMEAVLAATRNDARMAAANEMPGFARSLNYRLPLVRKVELRLGTNGNAFRDSLYGDIRNEDFYGLVISPNNLRERKRQKAIQSAQVAVYEAETRVLWQEAILERYDALTQLYFSRRLYAARAGLDSLLEVKQQLLLQMIEQGLDVKVKEIVDTENDRNALQFGMADSEKIIRREMAQIQSFMASQQPVSPAQLDFKNFITPEVIASVLAGYSQSLPVNSIYDYEISRTYLAQKELDYENSRDRQILSFVQIAYELPIVLERTPTRLNPNNNISFRLGLTLPLPGNNNLDRSEAALKLKEANNEVKIAQQETRLTAESQRAKIENLLQSLRNQREKNATSLVGKLLAADNVSLQLTPLESVELHVAQQKRELRLLEIEMEIAEEYLVFLEHSGYLGIQPPRNYLSVTLGEY